MHGAALAFTDFLVDRGVVESDDAEVYAFGFEILIANAVQVLVLLACGLWMGRLLPMALFTVFFVGVKRHIGGYHCNSHLGCIATSTGLSVAGVWLGGLLPEWGCFLLLAVAAGLIYKLAPIPHYNHPKTAEQLAEGRKIALRALVLDALVVTALFLLPVTNAAVYCAFGLFMAAMTLIIPIPDEEASS